MNPIQVLQKALKEQFPKATFELDVPLKHTASWWLDIRAGDYFLTVEWRPGVGFGVSTPRDGSYGEGPDEVYADIDAAEERIKALLTGRTRTKPPEEVRLQELRSLRHVSQVELAERLQIQQAAVSKLERRNDMLLSTLANVVAALGGSLEIRAMFPEGIVRVLRFDTLNHQSS